MRHRKFLYRLFIIILLKFILCWLKLFISFTFLPSPL
eukprot:UN04920